MTCCNTTSTRSLCPRALHLFFSSKLIAKGEEVEAHAAYRLARNPRPSILINVAGRFLAHSEYGLPDGSFSGMVVIRPLGGR